MALSERDLSMLRRLAEERAEIAALPVQAEKAEMWRRLNDLEPVRPLVWVNEVCWHEMEYQGELALQTEDPFAQRVESELRTVLYQWRHFPGDMIVEEPMYCPLVIRDSGLGIHEEATYAYTDQHSGVVSRDFTSQIDSEADVEKIQFPEVSLDQEATARDYERYGEVFAGISPVVQRGVPMIWFAPWDELIRWWDVQKAMLDLALRPELVHLAMERLTAAYLHRLDQMEAQNLLALGTGNVRIGSGGLGYTGDLPPVGYDPAWVRPGDTWGCATAQIFSEVSPAMHEEFALGYERRWLERWGLTYYGCCEPLHNKLEILASVPNLRKVSMSPWADVAKAAPLMAGKYVFSHKPNPAILAEDGWRPEVARKWLREVLEQTQGLAVEIILKDLSTVRYQPQRLWELTQIAVEEAERVG